MARAKRKFPEKPTLRLIRFGRNKFFARISRAMRDAHANNQKSMTTAQAPSGAAYL
jgi:hypothetical protein